MRVVLYALLITGALGVGFGVTPAAAQESQIAALTATANGPGGTAANALELGRALRRAGRITEALTELRGAISRFPGPDDVAPLYEELARVYVDKKDFWQALVACKKLDHMPGAAARIHVCNAEAQFVPQRATEALAEIATALLIDPRNYDARVTEGRAYELELDTARAAASLHDALAIRNGDAEAHMILGRVLFRGDRPAEGIAELRNAVALDPTWPDALFELAKAIPPGRESVGLLERATRERPNFSEAWLAIGVQELAAGHIAEAKRAANAVAKINPADTRARVLLGQIALAEGRTDDAIAAGRSVLKVVANDAAAELLVADGNAKKGEIDLALEAYQAAWGLDHVNPAPLVRASATCHSAGRDTSARAFGLRATQEFPSWGPAWVAFGDALFAQGEKQPARDAYQKALATTAGPVDRDSVRQKMGAP